MRDDSPFSVRTDPELGMYFVLRNNLAREDVPHEKIVVHGLRNNFSDFRRIEFNEAVVF